MRLDQIQILNFKGFHDSGPVRFTPGFNFVVGQNNAGKSALLEALSVEFPSNPHKSVKTKPKTTTPLKQISVVNFRIAVTGVEVRDALFANNRYFHVHFQRGGQIKGVAAKPLLEEILSRKDLSLNLTYRAAPENEIVPASIPSHGLYTADEQAARFTPIASDLEFQLTSAEGGINGTSEIGAQAALGFRRHLYVFKAERMNVGECPYGTSPVLATNAANLPEVLNVLQSNPIRFQRFNAAVSRVFPNIQHISVRPREQNKQLEVLVWTTDPSLEREDLAIALNDSGTGVGQVLAILYVAITSPTARTIVIDEPNSFLHPGAARKLMEILQEYKDQQYIVSTHSADVVSSVQVGTLTILRWQDNETKVEQLDPTNVDSIKTILRELGIRLADVFGADRILWVEGPTEEDCFPLIVDRILKKPLAGTSIVAVRDTGFLDARKPSAKLIWDIYSKVTQGRALIPPAIGFSFDREGRTDREMEDITRESKGRVMFLPRRMFENYLLDADAIAYVLTAQETNVDPNTIKQWIDEKYRTFLPKAVKDKEVTNWVEIVDAVTLFENLFQEISEGKLEYRKRIHGHLLTDWLTRHKPEVLVGLGNHLSRLMNAP